MRKSLCSKVKQTKILYCLRQENTPQTENRKRAKTPQSGQLDAWKVLINQGFSELKRSDSSIYIRCLKFSFLTVHTKIERRKTSELQTNYCGCRNTALHTDEKDNVHCRRADTAGCQRNQRSEQNRQKLADALAPGFKYRRGFPYGGWKHSNVMFSISALKIPTEELKDRLYNLTDDAPRNLHFCCYVRTYRRRFGRTDYWLFKRA